MIATSPTLRIAIYGPEETSSTRGRGCNLWPSGYAAAITAAGGTPVYLGESLAGQSWKEVLDGIQALVWTGSARPNALPTLEEQQLCHGCRKKNLPLLAVDQGMLALNSLYGGTLYQDLPSDQPNALQHRHPPESGLRHAITVEPNTRLAALYGEGEVVVNSEHRRAVCKVARGFRISARALDGILEAIETEDTDWFALGVQWRPASVSASGLDIQLFRGLLDASRSRFKSRSKRERAACTSAA
jgi:putative glutamine amidotransferase